MKHVLHDVETEALLTPLNREMLQPRSAISREDARADIRAISFWQRQQNAYFDVGSFTLMRPVTSTEAFRVSTQP